MKKDIEWLKKWLTDYENETIEELWTSSTNDYLVARLHGALSLLKEVKQRIDQLDEPEVNSQIDKLANFIMSEVEGEPSQNQAAVDTAIRIIKSYQNQETLSQEWLVEHSYNVHLLGTPDVEIVAVPRDDLEGLLVSKQELPVIPKFVADFIESYDGDFYSLLYDADNISSDASLVTEEYYELGNWLSVNSDELLQAVANGYEVEEEQKYYVDLDTAAYVAKWDGDGSVQIYTDSVSGSDEYELHLTEQEIKDYDPRFWPFAVKVEEVEE